MKLLGITGGIGSGKSMLSRACASMGFEVYDSDSRAKRLMTTSPTIIDGLISLFGEEVYNEKHILNRTFLARKIFSDSANRIAVNAIVHPVVCDDIKNWSDNLKENSCRFAFVESAILYESGMQNLLDAVIYVDAPYELRLQRAVLRDGVDVEAIMQRMQAQTDVDAANKKLADYILINDNKTLLLPQLVDLLNLL